MARCAGSGGRWRQVVALPPRRGFGRLASVCPSTVCPTLVEVLECAWSVLLTCVGVLAGDVGIWLRDQILARFKEKSKPLTWGTSEPAQGLPQSRLAMPRTPSCELLSSSVPRIKYIDPTYMVGLSGRWDWCVLLVLRIACMSKRS